MAVHHLFETFVETRTTAPAVRACRRVLEDLPRARGIVLLHGRSGTGKTHLLRGSVVEANRCGYRVREATAVELRAWLVESIRTAAHVTPWPRQAREVDLLVVDDLQALVSSPASQDGIARLFRQIGGDGTAILAASGVSPRALPAFERALASQPSYRRVPMRALPSLELRQVVETVAARRGLPLSPGTAQLIAERSRGDLGVMHGLLMQLGAAMRWRTKNAAAAAVARLYPMRADA